MIGSPGNRAKARHRLGYRFIGPLCLVVVSGLGIARAAVLPEDRSDAMYHYYDGGGVKVTGPALLVRKGITENVSVYGRYYTDTISSASVDVVTTASPYRDKREEKGVGVDYLHGNSLMQLSVANSLENDYLADTFNFNVSHELNGGLTTVTLGYTRGQDIVKRTNSTFQEDINRYQFRLGVSQVLTRSLLIGLDFEDVAEEGYLNNPYRSARILGAYTPERYPGTRDSQAVAIRAIKGFAGETRPVSSTVRLEYRYFRDNWDIRADTVEAGYQRYFGDRWTLEGRYRYYRQSAASFYSDNFTTAMAYMARDKELSQFHSHALGFKSSWQFLRSRLLFLDRASLSFAYDRLRFGYDNFTDVRTGRPYAFDANVMQLYLSAWY